MSSVYKKINGKNYVKSMLEAAEEKWALKKGGKLTLVDARNIFPDIKSESLSETEIRSISYILENYSFSEAALKWIEQKVSPAVHEVENVEAHTAEAEILSYREEVSEYKEAGTEDSSTFPLKKVILFFIVVAVLGAGVVFYLMKKGEQESYPVSVDDEQVSESKVEESAIVEAESDDKKSSEEPVLEPVAEPVKEEPQGRLYIVKHGDSLVKISIDIFGDYSRWQEIYRLNKDIITEPGLVYPGQKLKLPE
jgi:LysM repeat protein